MKRRLSEQFTKLDKVDKKLVRLDEKIKQERKELIDKERAIATEDRVRFIHNSHIHRFPLLRENKPPRKYFNLNLDENSFTIRNVFAYTDMCPLIFDHLGPCELYALTMVSTDFKALVTRVFTEIGGRLLKHYTIDTLAHPDPAREEKIKCEIAQYESLLTARESLLPDKRPSIESFLSLWYHCMSAIKAYTVVNGQPETCFMDYAFVYDITSDRLIRARDLNLYHVDDFYLAKIALRKRWEKEYGCHLKDGKILKNKLIRFLRYDELNTLSIRRINDIVGKKKTFIIDEKKKNISHFPTINYRVIYCDPLPVKKTGVAVRFGQPAQFGEEANLSNKPSNNAPFFDYYAIRLAYQRHPYKFPLSLSEHFERVQLSLLV